MLMDQFDSSGGVKLDRCVLQMIVDYLFHEQDSCVPHVRYVACTADVLSGSGRATPAEL